VFSGNLFTYGLPDKFRDLGRGSIIGIPTPIIILIILWIFSYYLFNQTRFGRYARAIGANEQAARVSGIEIDKYKMLFYIFIGILSALGGLIASARSNVIEMQTGLGYELDAIASVILGGTTLAGGTGSITGSILGAIMLKILSNGLQLIGVDTFIQKVVVGVIIIAGLAYAAWQNEQSKKTARRQMTEELQKTE
jgi:ribose/xylose/arabinose/galactoside ABC-type transport system permease subunit